MGRIILNSKGLNTEVGFHQIADTLNPVDLEDKTILAVTLEEYGINELLQNRLTELGFSAVNITICDGTKQMDLDAIYDYIYVGEGNTFDILFMMRLFGVVGIIQNSMHEGATYYGSSAGALIAGPSIILASAFDKNRVQMTDFEALSLIPGVVMPHFEREGLEQWKREMPLYLLEKFPYVTYVSNRSIRIMEYKH